MNVTINDKLYSDIVSFCEENEVKDIENFINSLLSERFLIKKYGSSPFEKMKEQNNIQNQPHSNKTIRIIKNKS